MFRIKQDNPPSKPNLKHTFSGIQPHHGNIENLFILSLPKTEGDPSLRCLILDGRRLALSHGCGEIYSYRGIALAVHALWNKGHRKLIVCVPEWMKTHEHLPYRDTHYLTGLQDHLTIFYVPSEAMEARCHILPEIVITVDLQRRNGIMTLHNHFMDALAREIGALIVTQLGPDTWSEPRERILPFTFIKDSFMLPEDRCRKNEPDLTSIHCLKNTRELSIQILVQWERFSEILKDPPDLNLSEEPGSDRGLLIIDGSNVAMSHGLDTFYSCLGIYLAVQYFWKKGYRNITACVPNWRYNSRNTVSGYEYLNMLYKKGLLALTPSQCNDDRLMLKEAKEENGLIVTNKVRNSGQEWKDIMNKRIPFEFDGNHFRVFPKGSEAVGKSTVRPPGMGEGGAYVQNTGQTLHPDPPRPEDEDANVVENM